MWEILERNRKCIVNSLIQAQRAPAKVRDDNNQTDQNNPPFQMFSKHYTLILQTTGQSVTIQSKESIPKPDTFTLIIYDYARSQIRGERERERER